MNKILTSIIIHQLYLNKVYVFYKNQYLNIVVDL